MKKFAFLTCIILFAKNIPIHGETNGNNNGHIIDPITQEDITNLDESERITIGPYTYHKKTILKHVINKIGSKKLDEIRDPMTRNPIGRDTIIELANHFHIPIDQLTEPEDLRTISEVPAGLSEATYLRTKHLFPHMALSFFRGMIQYDTLRALSHRLQVRENRTQMYPDPNGQEYAFPGEYELVKREINILKRKIRDKRNRYIRSSRNEEPFFFITPPE